MGVLWQWLVLLCLWCTTTTGCCLLYYWSWVHHLVQSQKETNLDLQLVTKHSGCAKQHKPYTHSCWQGAMNLTCSFCICEWKHKTHISAIPLHWECYRKKCCKDELPPEWWNDCRDTDQADGKDEATPIRDWCRTTGSQICTHSVTAWGVLKLKKVQLFYCMCKECSESKETLCGYEQQIYWWGETWQAASSASSESTGKHSLCT